MDWKAWGKAHWEKIGLGASVTALVGVGAMLTVLAAEQRELRALDDYEHAVQQALASNAPPPYEAPKSLDQARAPWGPMEAPAPASDWAMYYPTQIREEIIEPPPDLDKLDKVDAEKVVVVAPEGVNAVAGGPARVTVSWRAAKEAHGLGGFRIERRVAAVGPRGAGAPTAFAEIASLPADRHDYCDTDVAPDTAYEYRVSARGTKVVLDPKDRKVLSKEDLEAAAAAVTARTPSDLRITLVGGSDTTAVVRVDQLKEDGSPALTHTFQVQVGEAVGARVQIYRQGRPEPVDFSTGLKVAAIDRVQLPLPASVRTPGKRSVMRLRLAGPGGEKIDLLPEGTQGV